MTLYHLEKTLGVFGYFWLEFDVLAVDFDSCRFDGPQRVRDLPDRDTGDSLQVSAGSQDGEYDVSCAWIALCRRWKTGRAARSLFVQWN